MLEVNRSQSDFQWLYDALQYSCPERVVPPLKPPISLDATMSEFQRFLSRIAAHKVLYAYLKSTIVFEYYFCGYLFSSTIFAAGKTI